MIPVFFSTTNPENIAIISTSDGSLADKVVLWSELRLPLIWEPYLPPKKWKIVINLNIWFENKIVKKKTARTIYIDFWEFESAADWSVFWALGVSTSLETQSNYTSKHKNANSFKTWFIIFISYLSYMFIICAKLNWQATQNNYWWK